MAARFSSPKARRRPRPADEPLLRLVPAGADEPGPGPAGPPPSGSGAEPACRPAPTASEDGGDPGPASPDRPVAPGAGSDPAGAGAGTPDPSGPATPDPVAARVAPDPGGSACGPGALGLPDEAWVAALASLDGMGPARLRALLAERPPAELWRAIVAGRLDLKPVAGEPGPRRGGARALLGRWRAQASAHDVARGWDDHRRAGVIVLLPSSPRFPPPLAADHEPPAVLFAAGDPAVVRGPRVAVVGTRDCTRYGYDVARRLGAELAASGVAVVSGLALGIDGAAHAGALDAGATPPVAVVGSGLDRLYPARNAPLWRRVAAAGVVLSEYPLGSPPLAWHFPARNRLIVALSDLVVVVESPEHGGSMLTVDCAIERDVDVMAVPGPVTARTSAGPNRLLSEGRAVVRDATDVLVALGLTQGRRAAAAEAADRRPPPAPADRAVLDAFDWQPATFDQLVLRTGRAVIDLAPALDRLADAGWVEQRGGWYERLAGPP